MTAVALRHQQLAALRREIKEVWALSRNLRGVAVWRRALWRRTWKSR